MNDLRKSFLLAAAVTIIQNIAHIGTATSNMTFFLLRRMNYVGIYMNTANMVELCTQLFPVIVFEITFGVYMYRHFCTACVYYFSRQDNRVRWFAGECGKLLGYSFSYFFLCALFNIVVGMSVYHIPMNGYHMEAIVYMVIFPTLYTFIFTLWINVLSVVLGGQNAFALMVGIQYLFVFATLLAERDLTLRHSGTWKLYLNPVANMIQQWHSDIASVGEGTLEAPFLSHYSLLYYIAAAVVSVLITTMLIRKQDISLENKEERG